MNRYRVQVGLSSYLQRIGALAYKNGARIRKPAILTVCKIRQLKITGIIRSA